ncbi:MAG: CoA synthetase [Alphaproteobacteria bacterium]|nr:CoA synthetase [Alphaproteobacteria bacterium]
MDASTEELLIVTIARLLHGCRHVAVGALSPIPGSAALLARRQSGGRMRVSVLGSRQWSPWSNGGVELFDCAGQGRMDAFFLSGGQIDGQANVNLVGVGDYPTQQVRWSGSFGSAYLYFVVPKVILFREEHSRRTLVEKVDFISAPGSSPANVYRPGGPYALITSRCLFHFDKHRARFRLTSVHPGHEVAEVRDNTGFDFDLPEAVPVTAEPDPGTLALLRGEIAGQVADPYPQFAERLFGVPAAGRAAAP